MTSLVICNLVVNISDKDLFTTRFYKGRASPGSVTPDETGDGIAGAEPQKIR